MSDEPVKLVSTKPETEIAADLKRRIEEALVPVCALMDEAAAQGLQVVWDGIGMGPPFMRHRANNLRLIKSY